GACGRAPPAFIFGTNHSLTASFFVKDPHNNREPTALTFKRSGLIYGTYETSGFVSKEQAASTTR
ncbi:MAG TPA: hypothetical protein VFU37_09360, partial [Pyrinomonadaceae bacterium]|nr:hypothetical protein [Pyrinomonadaceae bacterium]